MTPDLQIFESYRPLLFSIAYRMLGSAMEAEDILQEAYVRYQNAQDQEIQYPKAYLSTIVTRLCLDTLKSAKTQREEYLGTWLPEPILTGDSPAAILGRRETISTAFLVLMESLSPVERAVFLLREVFDYSYAEIAEIIGKSEENCRQHYHRAKRYLVERRPRFEPSPAEQKKLVEGFLQAVSSGDIEGLAHLLSQDASIYGDGGGKVPSARRPITGREAVMRLLSGSFRLMPSGWRGEVLEVNGSPALAFLQGDQLLFVTTFGFEKGRIKEIFNMLNPDKLAGLSSTGHFNSLPKMQSDYNSPHDRSDSTA
jgi:RNA polymerase sigma-70 factor (ECF subfamily)